MYNLRIAVRLPVPFRRGCAHSYTGGNPFVNQPAQEDVSKTLRDVLDDKNYDEKRPVIPILGAGVTFYEKYTGLTVEEIAKRIREEIVPTLSFDENTPPDLQRVAQCARNSSQDRLRDHLQKVFTEPQEPNDIHNQLAKWMARRGSGNGLRIVLTTNYDCLLERAMEIEKSAYIVLSYSEPRPFFGGGKLLIERFLPDQVPEQLTLDTTDDYTEEMDARRLLREYPTIIKLHGSTRSPDSTFFITEAQYLRMLTVSRSEQPMDQLMSPVRSVLRGARYVCIGYSLQDPHVRAFLFRMSASDPLEPGSFPRAWILKKPKESNADFINAIWEDPMIKDRFPVEIVEVEMTRFVTWLGQVLNS